MLVHIGLVVVFALLAFLINPSDSWKTDGDENPTLYVLMLLAVSISIPYFTLASTGPIVQARFARVRPGASPYRLYSLSNVGSYLALLSFPYLFEPYLSLPAMGMACAAVYGIFAISCIGTSLAVFAILSRVKTSAEDAGETSKSIGSENTVSKLEMPTAWIQALWIGLPALASLTMIAATDHVSHNVAPEPRLWITTFGLYLLTFIITFDHERWYKRNLVVITCGLAILFLSVPVHLLTHEAFQIYQKRLATNGFIVAHATNFYLNLYPVIKRQAEEIKTGFRCHHRPYDIEKFIRKNFCIAITNDQVYLDSTINHYPPICDSEGNELPTKEPN